MMCNKDAVSNVQPFPRSIMKWSGLLYNKVFEGIADFHLLENDYVFGDRMFGGNAQSITKNGWIHRNLSYGIMRLRTCLISGYLKRLLSTD
ncbi:hypothetical protein Fmac_017539 [Flemingia macrophylla]|uniref:Uncharacterized protein n=1 Tax=Flemingia macrophylla TaxID=520843 RepID=A0ABD1M330_9FABA